MSQRNENAHQQHGDELPTYQDISKPASTKCATKADHKKQRSCHSEPNATCKSDCSRCQLTTTTKITEDFISPGICSKRPWNWMTVLSKAHSHGLCAFKYLSDACSTKTKVSNWINDKMNYRSHLAKVKKASPLLGLILLHLILYHMHIWSSHTVFTAAVYTVTSMSHRYTLHTLKMTGLAWCGNTIKEHSILTNCILYSGPYAVFPKICTHNITQSH